MIAIIDYGVGNLRSISKAIENIGKKVEITCDKKVLLKAEGIVLPGVGAFVSAMNFLREKDLVETIFDFAKTGKIVFGICLGMQLFFEESQEGKKTKGLGLLKGKVKKLPSSVKLPHIGWNTANGKYYYFVHSYYCQPQDKKIIVAKTKYGIEFPSIIRKNNIIGTQFHPEKSSKAGIELLKSFLGD